MPLGITEILLGGSILSGLLGSDDTDVAGIQAGASVAATKVSAQAQKDIAKLRALTDVELAQISRQTGIDIAKLQTLADLDIAKWNSLTQTEIAKLQSATDINIANLNAMAKLESDKLASMTSAEIANLQAQTSLDTTKLGAITQLATTPTSLPGADSVAQILSGELSEKIGIGLTEEEKQVYRGAARTSALKSIESIKSQASKTAASQGLKGGSIASILSNIEESKIPAFASIESDIAQKDIAQKQQNISNALAFSTATMAPSATSISDIIAQISDFESGKIDTSFINNVKTPTANTPTITSPNLNVSSGLNTALNKNYTYNTSSIKDIINNMNLSDTNQANQDFANLQKQITDLTNELTKLRNNNANINNSAGYDFSTGYDYSGTVGYQGAQTAADILAEEWAAYYG